MAKERCCGCQKLGHYRRDCPKCNRDKKEDNMTKEVKEPESKKLKKEEAK